MNFLAALLLLLMEEEAAFWCLAAVAEDVLPGYYEDDMLASAADQRVLATFVREKFPRVHDAFETSGAPLSAVTTSWFSSVSKRSQRSVTRGGARTEGSSFGRMSQHECWPLL